MPDMVREIGTAACPIAFTVDQGRSDSQAEFSRGWPHLILRATERTAPLACRPELSLNRAWGGVDHLTRPSHGGRNRLVAVLVGGHELGCLGVSQDVDP